MNDWKKITLMMGPALVALGMFAVPGATRTANAQDDESADGKLAIEEIIVTSRKREESLFDIPVAVTAFSSDDIQEMALDELPDLVEYTPGFHYAMNSVGRGGRFNRRLVFRGMNPRTDRQTRQAATVFIDGAPTIGSEIGTTDNYERIEIIKGPQSAYFGRSTFSGAINAITKTPGNEWGGQFNAEAASFGRTDFGLQVEGPIVQDKLFFRVSGRQYGTDGEWVNSGDPSVQLGAESTRDAGLSLYWTPSEKFSAKLRVRRWKDDDGPSVGIAINQLDNGQLATCAPGGSSGNTWGGDWPCGPVPVVDASNAGMDTALTPALIELFYNDAIRNEMIFTDVPFGFGLERNAQENSLVMDYEFSNAMLLTSITAYHVNEFASFEDFDRRPTAGLGTCTPLASDPTLESCSGDSYNFNLTSNKTFSQELRLTSAQDRKLRWSAGFSYAEIEALLQGFSKIGGGTPNPFGAVSNFDPQTTAVFGSIAWDFTDKFTLNVEARYQEDKVKEGTVGGTQFEETFTSTTPRVILDYKPNENTTIYGTYAQGSQPGQFNATVSTLPDAEVAQLLVQSNCGAGADVFDCLVAVGEEEVTNYEIGIKTLFWDGRAQLSVAAYFMDWDKIVAPNILTIIDTEGANQGEPKNVQVNATGGQADMSGLEFEGTVLLSDSWSLDGTFSLVNSKINTFESPDANRLFGDYTIDGMDNEFSRYPSTSGTLSVSYNNSLSQDHDFFARGDLIYRGSTWMTNANVSETGSTSTLNLRFGVQTEMWRIEAYGTNLTDEKGYSAFQYFPDLSFVAGGRVVMGSFIPKTAYGMRVSLFF